MNVNFKCPECKTITKKNIDYTPAGRGAGFSESGTKVEEQSFEVCPSCKKQYVYRLDVEIVCESSKLNF